jgi:3-hydroxypropanoate dehydrogenase
METAETRTDGGAIGTEALGRLFLQARTRRARLDPLPRLSPDNAEVDAALFEDAPRRSDFVRDVGYGVPGQLHPRDTRLDFTEACRIA